MKAWSSRIVICLVLGVVTTVLSSWTLALLLPRGAVAAPRFSRDVRYFDDAARHRLWFFTMRGSPWVNEIVCANVIPTMSRDQRVIDPARAVDASMIPVWSIMRRAQPATTGPYIEIGYGWPAPGLWMQVDHSVSPQVVTGAIAIPRPLRNNSAVNGLPIQPRLWPLAVNVTVHAALWMGIIYGGGAVRGRLRRRRGHCMQCGYDLRGCSDSSVCPECGIAQPALAVGSQSRSSSIADLNRGP